MTNRRLVNKVEILKEENRKLRLDNQLLNERLRQIELLANRTTPLPTKVPSKIFSSSIRDLNLSTRTLNSLESGRIETIGQLVTWNDKVYDRDERSLLKIRAFGRTSLREVKIRLADLGLALGMTNKEIATWTSPPPPASQPPEC